MARRALGYLNRNPVAEVGYQCRFWLKPLNCPPFTPDPARPRGLYDPITTGDTEKPQRCCFRFHERADRRGPLGPRRRQCTPGCALICETTANIPASAGSITTTAGGQQYTASLWTTGMLLHSEVLRFRETGDADAAMTARRMFVGLRKRRDGANRAGRITAPVPRRSPRMSINSDIMGTIPAVLTGLCEYYTEFRDEEGLALARELAEGFLYDIQPDNLHRADGGVDGHNHVQLHAARGMAQLAYITADPRYLKWVRDIYDFYRRWALDSAWLPEIRDLKEHSNHSETCLNADMHEIEIWLAKCGYTELWDRAERGFRNYFAPLQFLVTPRLEEIYRGVNAASHTPDEIGTGLAMLREFEGAFCSGIMPNERLIEIYPGDTHYGERDYDGKKLYFDLMGCCPPEGMRALWFTAENVMTVTSSGEVMVNMAFDRDTREAEVRSELPSRGRYTVKAKRAGTYLLRFPTWTLRDRVKLTRGTTTAPVEYGGPGNMYVTVRDVLPGDTLTLEYPLMRASQDASITPYSREPLHYRFEWLGNTITGVTPEGKYLPMFRDEVY